MLCAGHSVRATLLLRSPIDRATASSSESGDSGGEGGDGGSGGDGGAVRSLTGVKGVSGVRLDEERERREVRRDLLDTPGLSIRRRSVDSRHRGDDRNDRVTRVDLAIVDCVVSFILLSIHSPFSPGTFPVQRILSECGCVDVVIVSMLLMRNCLTTNPLGEDELL